eukprot:GDKH01006173.1.p2 GENE.GDKH01006173.1~~GDKH01006173.1.p2  ORF type:complete len:53 (-),score=4.41 GDKH01006173.1:44-202(-)
MANPGRFRGRKLLLFGGVEGKRRHWFFVEPCNLLYFVYIFPSEITTGMIVLC